jgi:hypothetical protein
LQAFHEPMIRLVHEQWKQHKTWQTLCFHIAYALGLRNKI